MAAFNNTDVEVPATMTVDGRTLQGRRRAFPRRIVVHDGAGRPEAIAQRLAPISRSRSRISAATRRFNLLNANNDPTFLRAFLYTQIARRYIPAPEDELHARRDQRRELGCLSQRAAVQQRLAPGRVQDDRRGALEGARAARAGARGLEYLGEDLAAYRQLYEIKTKDDAESWKALVQLCKVLNETPADKLEAALAPLLDIDGALKFLAIEVALVNSDGYWTRASDYNLYRDTDRTVSHHPARRERGRSAARAAAAASAASVAAARSSIRWSRSTTRASRCARSSWRCRRSGRGISATSATSPPSGSTGTRIQPMLKAAHDLIGGRGQARHAQALRRPPASKPGSPRSGNPLKNIHRQRRAFLLRATATTPPPGRAARPRNNPQRAAN